MSLYLTTSSPSLLLIYILITVVITIKSTTITTIYQACILNLFFFIFLSVIIRLLLLVLPILQVQISPKDPNLLLQSMSHQKMHNICFLCNYNLAQWLLSLYLKGHFGLAFSCGPRLIVGAELQQTIILFTPSMLLSGWVCECGFYYNNNKWILRYLSLSGTFI